MKLKLKNPQPAADGPAGATPADGQAQAAQTPTSAAPKLKFKLSAAAPPPQTEAAPVEVAPKPKRKYTKKAKVDEDGAPFSGAKAAPKPKKRPLEDGGEEGTPAKRKPKPTEKSLLAAAFGSDDEDEDELAERPTRAPPVRMPPLRTQSVKISLKSKTSRAPGIATIKVKSAGKPPVRPPGVGYDSEAEEAEIDPAIESQFVLRMQPGKDCDLLRKAITEKTIGKSSMQGGLGVHFRFFDREGRRAMITIQGNAYAATMVELPCVIESLKSWNKKDWVKSADVCQMLMVLGRVSNEEEAKKFPRPREVDPDSHRYPHGLTPPMQWVRKRRFRPRKSYLDVERIETHTESLLVADDDAERMEYNIVESDAESGRGDGDSDEDAEGSDEEDAGDVMDYATTETPAEAFADNDEFEQMVAAGFLEDDVQVDADDDTIQQLLSGAAGDGDGADSTMLEIETPLATSSTSRAAAMQALQNGNANIVLEPESAASTPDDDNEEDDDDDDDDGDDDEEDELSSEAKAQQAALEQTRAELRELDEAIAANIAQRDSTSNKLYKRRLQARIEEQEKDRKAKLSKIGGGEDE